MKIEITPAEAIELLTNLNNKIFKTVKLIDESYANNEQTICKNPKIQEARAIFEKALDGLSKIE